MPTSIIHIAVAIIFSLIFIFGVLFPDLGKFVYKDFWTNKCCRGFFSNQDQCRYIPKGVFHNYYLWIGILIFSLGCLLHLIMDDMALLSLIKTKWG